MPPKKKGGRKKKKKQQEPPVARPEPMDMDENEINYMWDRIAPSQPNPLSTAASLYTFATNQVVGPAGPIPTVVAGVASPSVPLLSPHPPAPPSQPFGLPEVPKPIPNTDGGKDGKGGSKKSGKSGGGSGKGGGDGEDKSGGGGGSGGGGASGKVDLNTIMSATSIAMMQGSMAVVPPPGTAGSLDRQSSGGGMASPQSPASPSSPLGAGGDTGGDGGESGGSGGAPSAPFLRHSGFFAPQKPPRKTDAVRDQRAVVQVSKSERAWQELERKLEAKEEDEHMIYGSTGAQRSELKAEHGALAREINELDAKLEENQQDYETQLNEQQHVIQIRKCELEGVLSGLHEDRSRVVANLQDRDFTYEEIANAKAKLEKMKKDHDALKKKTAEDLTAEVAKLKHDMVNKLMKTLHEMEVLTNQHRERRQQRAVSESARLVSKLTTLEAKSKALTTQNNKLGSRVESTKRDQQLEQERHHLLARKSAGLAQEIRELSAQLQQCEKLFAERTGATSQSNEVLTLSETIDKQYRVILELKNELDTVKADNRGLEVKLKDVQRSHFQSLQTASSGNAKSLVTTTSQPMALANTTSTTAATAVVGETTTAEQKAKIRAIIIKAVSDINKSMLDMSSGARGIDSVTDPQEQSELLGYIQKRIAMFKSGVFPTKPKINSNPQQKKIGAGNVAHTNALLSRTANKVAPALLRGPGDKEEESETGSERAFSQVEGKAGRGFSSLGVSGGEVSNTTGGTAVLGIPQLATSTSDAHIHPIRGGSTTPRGGSSSSTINVPPPAGRAGGNGTTLGGNSSARVMRLPVLKH